jgi:alkylation response protein AidB-like acyl-CoA dehydrogenase
MDLTPDDLQRQVLESVNRILERRADPQRTRALVDAGGYDHDLHDDLAQAGFLDLPVSGAGPLEAALVAEAVARQAGLVSATATGLVYPMLTGEAAPGPVALASGVGKPFRMAQFAKAILVSDGEHALRLIPEPGDVAPVDNDRTGWPLGELTPQALDRAERLPPGSGPQLVNWWRTALAIDAAGTMRGALAVTTRYVSERVQFGRPIGSFQAIQHRLAQMTVQAEGARWLALEAAYRGAEAGHAARAATWATTTMPTVLRETQQMHGAIGFTREYPLHLWTMRMPALQRELGGFSAHARDAAKLWVMGADRAAAP